ncbi:MAG: AMP-binding protein [Deltaproteobacteria bacterium]|nr:AMP-binding protein [Candidatus Anaeroferrophillus wilburensis]MBN2889127.1 AMP-binding protein [Deltaproteobacteria bacterium]
MALWLNLGDMLRVNAVKYPQNIAFCDKERRFTFPMANQRVNQLANSLLAMGLQKGDTVSCFLENCIEICELYIACAKIGVIINPINFRLVAPEVEYIVTNADAKAFFVHDEFVPMVEEIRAHLSQVQDYIVVGGRQSGYREYEDLLTANPATEPSVKVDPADPWILLYTSGTTGRPKGVVRSHESYVAFYLINGCDFSFGSRDFVLTCMPLCHVNTTFFSFTVTYLGGSNYIHPARSFRPAEILDVVQREKITFISLIPTHYNLIFSLPEDQLRAFDLSSVQKLLCSSAPARIEHKKAILELIAGVRLFEGYGSTEAGIVCTLMPEDQLTKPGSIGKESAGTDLVKILDDAGKEVAPGEVGELYSRSPMLFDGYYKLPEATAEAFAGEYFSAGDMARRDEDGYYYLVDRKKNMIITGGENVYPSEVENVLAAHEAVFDVAVIGLPDKKWGERVTAVVIPKEGRSLTGEELISMTRGQLAPYKCPKEVIFIAAEEMPRTGTGKILHRILRERYASQ